MKYDLTVREGRSAHKVEAEGGSLLIEALSRLKGPRIEAPCGGKGLCGKCRVRVLSGRLSAPEAREELLLSEVELASGLRLACLARVEGDAEIELPERGAASIVSAGPELELIPDPPVRRVAVALAPAGPENRGDDESRLLEAIAQELARTGSRHDPPRRVALSALPGLADSCRLPGQVGAVIAAGEVIGVAPCRAEARSLGLGVDLGTTTVVCRLLDLATGEDLGSASELNAQSPYGADVISRIDAASVPRGLESLQILITSQIAEMARELVRGSGAEIEDLISIAAAGNTTMLHLLAGVPPGAIARAPFTSAFLGARIESAAALGLAGHPGCAAILLPGVSAYVGADIVAGMAAIRLHEASGRSLYLDLGTNGEVALGGKDGIVCCATTAGPAFEGALIEKGSSGVEGAIDSVWIEDGAARYGTIGGRSATGICGSGLIDALAAFLDLGLLDETGRIADNCAGRLYLDEERDIYLSQADVRSAQLAKAAIAAGIDSLLAAAHCGIAEVERLYLAGGFGSLLGLRAAVRIGLFPPELAGRVVVVGNASGAGAAAACLSATSLEACSRVAGMCEYLELSGRSDFNAAYIERMAFPERG